MVMLWSCCVLSSDDVERNKPIFILLKKDCGNMNYCGAILVCVQRCTLSCCILAILFHPNLATSLQFVAKCSNYLLDNNLAHGQNIASTIYINFDEMIIHYTFVSHDLEIDQ